MRIAPSAKGLSVFSRHFPCVAVFLCEYPAGDVVQKMEPVRRVQHVGKLPGEFIELSPAIFGLESQLRAKVIGCEFRIRFVLFLPAALQQKRGLRSWQLPDERGNPSHLTKSLSQRGGDAR